MGKQVNDILKKICAEIGYVQKRDKYIGNIYMKSVSTNIYSTICFNIASYQIKGHRLIAPIIGVIYSDVESLLRRVSKFDPRKYSNTIDEHIGYIMPVHDWTEWDLIEPGTNSEVVLNDLKSALLKYSIIYYERFSNIENVIAKAEDMPWGPAYYSLLVRLPIMYYLAGRKRSGERFINRAFEKGYNEVDKIFTDEYISNYMSLPDNHLDAK